MTENHEKPPSVHIIGSIRKDPTQLGQVASVLVDKTRDACILTTTDTEMTGEPYDEDSIKVYARQEVGDGNTLPLAEELTAPLIIASTGVDIEQYEDASQPVINAENLAPEIWQKLQKLKNIMEYYPKAEVMCIEVHQEQKGFKSIPGTAKEGMMMATRKDAETLLAGRVQIESLEEWEKFLANKAKNPEQYYGKIISVRSNEVSASAFDVPAKYFSEGHGIHQFLIFEDNELKGNVKTRILGREPYGEGLVALLNALHDSPEEFKNGVTHIRKFVENEVLEAIK